MNKCIIACALVLTLAACDQDVEPGFTRLSVYENSAVQEAYPLVKSGDNLVFHFFQSGPNDPTIIDEEFAEDFLFEINTSENSFNYSSDDLSVYTIPLVYRQYCFCSGFNEVEMTTFNLEGIKQSNGDWILRADVLLTLSYVDDQDVVQNEWTHEINVNGRFIKSNRPE